MIRMSIAVSIALAFIVAVPSAGTAFTPPACDKNDAVCGEFRTLYTTDQFEAVISRAESSQSYSAASRYYIGQSFLAVAGRETNTLEQEDHYCRKALEYGATSAYMGLYFIHAVTDPEKALGYLEQYAATNPQDSVPFVILGETELNRKNYRKAETYLQAARKVARGRSSNLDWLSFQASYLLGDYASAVSLFESAVTQGHGAGELRSLMTDPRFAGIEKRPEFRKYEPLFKGTSARSTQSN